MTVIGDCKSQGKINIGDKLNQMNLTADQKRWFAN